MHLQSIDLKSNTVARLMSIASIKARMSVLAVAYSAMRGAASPHDIRHSGASVTAVFGPDHDLTREMQAFCAEMPGIRFRPSDLREAGERLQRAVERTTWPDHAARVDLDG